MRALPVLFLAACGRIGFADLTAPSDAPVQVTLGTTDVAASYPLHADWNTYIDNSGGGSTAASRPDSDCASTTSYFSCLHGGEIREFVVEGVHTCDGLTASDDLGGFIWRCSNASDPVTFHSVGLADGKGLRDLVDATAWKLNKVTVSRSATPIFQTPASAWWGNPVMPLPAETAPAALTGPGTIYTIATNTTTPGVDLFGASSDRVAIVTLGTAILSTVNTTKWCATPTGSIGGGGTTTAAVICAGNVADVWLEVHIGNSVAVDNAIMLGDDVTFTRLHGAELDGNSKIGNGITLTTTPNMPTNHSNLIDHSSAHDNTGVGFNTLLQTTWDTIATSVATHNGAQGFWLGAHSMGSKKVMSENVAADNALAGADVDLYDEQFAVVRLTTVNNGGPGASLAGNYADYIAVTSTLNAGTQFDYPIAGNPFKETFTNFALVGAGGNGDCLGLESNNGAILTDMLVAHCSVGIDAISASVTFGGAILIGDDGKPCANSGNNSTIDTACNHGANKATAPIANVDTVDAFGGVITATDASNASAQVNGTTAYPPKDWIDFATPFRAWGQAGSNSLFDASRGGVCAGTCQLYEWELRATDPTLLNHYGAFPTDGSACPSSVNAAVAENVISDFNAPPLVFLRAAVEIMDPWINPNGNYDGLCESNEVCLYTPNLGAYQGSGDLTTRTCQFTGGNGVTGVTLYAYPINGL